WSIELRPVLHAPDGSDIPKGYMAVATDLINHRGAEVVDDSDGEATKMTVKNPFSGVFEEQFVQTNSLKQTDSGGSVTVEVPYLGHTGVSQPAAPPPVAAPRRSYSLLYRHPITQQAFTHRITKPITTIGRVTETNADVDLRIAVEVQVSEEHAKLRVDAASGRVDILDVSSYGTTVNGQTVPPSNPARHNENWVPVPEGAEIGLAGYVFLTLRADPA
ncbi:MAG: FHA domain-containing protein, partial [Bacteroidota bacterium]